LNGVVEGTKLKGFLDDTTLGDIWYDGNGNPRDGSSYDEYLHFQTWSTVARMMRTREDRKVDRDFFYTNFGGWDHHNEMKDNLEEKLEGLNFGLQKMVDELKDSGLWEYTTIVVTSDFARTITPNDNDGSDHAWGGHYFMLGGNVKGGHIHGKYPDDITPRGPLNIDRGRIIPTTSWDSIWAAVVGWLGVDSAADLNYCLPNLANTVNTEFPAYARDDLFDPETSSVPSSYPSSVPSAAPSVSSSPSVSTAPSLSAAPSPGPFASSKPTVEGGVDTMVLRQRNLRSGL
jgi:hypothetical protein